MNYLSIDHVIVYSFLLITLIIGLWAGRGIKNIREYAIANKMYGTGVLTISFLATYLGGHNTIGTQKSMLSYGLIAGLTVLGSAIMLVYSGAYFVPKMLRFQKSITLGDLMQELYGPHGGIITGIIGCLYTISLVGVQVVSMGHICKSLLGWNVHWTTVVGGLILIIYSSLGGVKSVTITDIFQFIVFVVVIPLIANTAISKVGGIKELFSNLPVDKLTVYKHEQFTRYLVTFLVWCLFPAAFSSPPVIQRILMAQHKQQAANMLFISAAFILCVRALLIFTCMAVLLLDPNIKPSSGGAFAYVINQYFSPLLKGLSVAGLLAIVMSTLDSFLNAGGILFTHNVIKPLCDRQKIAFNELKAVRYITFLMGCVSILAALNVEEVRTLSYFGMSSFAPIITIPLIAGILGLKTDIKCFLMALLLTFPTFLAAHALLSAAMQHWVYPLSLIVNALTFFGCHYLTNKGFVMVKREEASTTALRWQPQWLDFFKWLPTPKRLLNYSRVKLDKYGANPTLFALFMSFNYMIPIFMHSYTAPHVYNWLLAIRGIGALLCVGLLLKSYWPKQLLSYFPSYYHFSLMYCLPFTASFLFFLEGSSVEWLINVSLTIMFLIVLVDWMSFIILTVLGITLGLLFYAQIVDPIDLHLDFSTGYLLVYTCFFSTLIALLFSRRKEQHLEAKLREIAEHHYTMVQGEAYTHPATLRIATMIERQVQEVSALYHQPSSYDTVALQKGEPHTDPDFLQYFFPTALEVIKQGNNLNQHLVQVIMTDGIAPHLSLFSLQACVAAILEAYCRRHQQSMHIDLSEDYRIYTSFAHLQYALIHVLRFLHAHHLREQVSLWLRQQSGVHIRLSGQALSPSLLHELFSLFPTKETTKHLGLAISRVLIEAQGGRLLYETHALPQNPYTEFIITIPPAEDSPASLEVV